MRVAIEGCLHGEIDEVYAQVSRLQKKVGDKFDLLIICGDFQAIRDQLDLDDMHCPEKYKQMGTFRDYYEGRKQAPVLTILIGGNHEAVNSLRESHFGGWLAPKIYFLGQAGSIFVRKGNKKLRVTGCSGIYNHSDFKYCTRLERYPLKGKDRITTYHTKQLDVFRMELLARIATMKKQSPEVYGKEDTEFDIMLSHDWPKDIALFGNTQELFKMKPYFQKEIETGTLGSPPMKRFLKTAQPSYWFSAHMHIKYPAIYPHPNNYFTHFLSLDKCQGQRACLEMLHFDLPQSEQNQEKQHESEEVSVEVDPTWIAVLLLTRNLLKGSDNLYYFDKQEVIPVDINRMNNLIESYPALRPKLQEIGTYRFDENLSQIEQTEHFLKKIGISIKEVEGLCYEKGFLPAEEEDEIELEL